MVVAGGVLATDELFTSTRMLIKEVPMRSAYVARVISATAVAVGVAAVVATTAGAQSQPPAGASASSQPTAPAEQVTVVGCIEREADYRRAKDAGRGGVAGTGVGAGNEFVLTNASLSKGTRTGATGTAGANPETPTGTAGAMATSTAYELTGAGEGQASQHVGRRVEISGKLKAAEVQAGAPTGGATAGQPPAGIDVAGRDLKLRELEVSSIREASGTCPAK